VPEYDPRKPLISIHIPKTGGSSFRAILNDWFGSSLLLHYFDPARGRMPKKHRLKNIWSEYKSNVCIHGHFNNNRGFGVRDYYPNLNQFITLVREPLEMQISLFHFNLQRFESSPAKNRQQEPCTDLNEFLEVSKPFMLNFFPSDLTEENLKETMQKYDHIGVVERYSKSIQILSEKLNKPLVTIPNKNLSPRIQQASPSSKSIFMEKASLEYAIWEYAMDLNS